MTYNVFDRTLNLAQHQCLLTSGPWLRACRVSPHWPVSY